MINDDYDLPYIERKELQSNFREYLITLKPHFFATLNFNLDLDFTPMSDHAKQRRADFGKRLLGEFQRNLDRRLFGKKFYKLPPYRRSFFIALPEHIETNLHYHMVLKAPQRVHPIFFENAAYALNRVIRSADILIEQLHFPDDLRMTSFYSSKDLIQKLNFDNFVISTEFQRQTKIKQENGEQRAFQ